MENVWDYPRPPALEPVSMALRIVFGGVTIASTMAGYRVLETSHPPVYYLPADAFIAGALEPAPGRSFCEWKGNAQYWNIRAGDKLAPRAAWSYPTRHPASPQSAIIWRSMPGRWTNASSQMRW